MQDYSKIEKINELSDAGKEAQNAFIASETDKHAQEEFEKLFEVDSFLKSVPPVTAGPMRESTLERLGIDDRSIKLAARRRKIGIYSGAAGLVLILGVLSRVIFPDFYLGDSSSEAVAEKEAPQIEKVENQNTSVIENNILQEEQIQINSIVAEETSAGIVGSRVLNESSRISDDILSANDSGNDSVNDSDTDEEFENGVTIALLDAPGLSPVDTEIDSRLSGATSFDMTMFPADLRLGRILENIEVKLNYYGINSNYPKSPWGNTSRFTDMSVAVMYRINQKHCLGLTAGNDLFVLNYEHRDGMVINEVDQELPQVWFGAAYQYEFSPLLTFAGANELAPYAYANFAYAGVGMYSQLNTGLKINFSQGTSILFGVNSGLLLYQADNWETSSKIGLNIGMQFGL
jgi:hypothetical protein